MTIYKKSNPTTIQEMFNSIAKQYDRTNALLSFRMHKCWNRSLINKAIIPSKPEVLLDLCCGTGAIAFEYLKKVDQVKNKLTKVYMLDFSEGMLECARSQAKKQALDYHPIHYLQADARVIPLLNNSVDCATMAYGIRNINDPLACIKDVYRVLDLGGTFGLLELTQPTSPFLKFTHSLYLKKILPFVGKLATSNKEAYEYLCDSIHNFISPESIKQKMQVVGFQDIQVFSLFGGIATVLVGTKPR